MLVLRPVDSEEPTDDVRAMLNSKNVLARGGKINIDSLSDEQLKAQLSAFDGVVLASGFSHDDFQRIRLAGVPILASYDQAAQEAKDTATVADDIRGVDMTYTGVIPVVYKAQHALLTALEAYADALTASGWPLPYRLRDELFLYRRITGMGRFARPD